MKRKLNDHNVPEEPAKTSEAFRGFEHLHLDSRLLKGVAAANFEHPTPVQSRAIPLALGGKNLLIKSKTGSGKTLAYVIPLLQSLLEARRQKSSKRTASLILTPTKELGNQVSHVINTFLQAIGGNIRCENLSTKEDERVQRARLADYPDIVVATPARAAIHVGSKALDVSALTHIVIDEADLVLSYGYDEDLRLLAEAVPKLVQSMLISATLKPDVDLLQTLFCRDPIVVDFSENEEEDQSLKQYIVKCAEEEKFLLIYAIFKLKLIKGKCIVFVANIDRCYRLRLFLEQFGIRSCVLNSELPINSRVHIVEEFNKNVYDIIIASDDHEIIGDEEEKTESPAFLSTAEAESNKHPKKRSNNVAADNGQTPRNPKDPEYGVSRGIDFQNVSCVLNFDLPTSAQSYTHRIGRTARAGKSGIALSFIIPTELYRKHKSTSISSASNDMTVLSRIESEQKDKGQSIEPYAFDMNKLEGFRYRMVDALRAVTGIAVRSARVNEIRNELLKSEKLRRHFEENPDAIKWLRHDEESHTARKQAHLKHVPNYLLPGAVRPAPLDEHVSLRKGEAGRKSRMGKSVSRIGRGRGNRANPLRSFTAKGRK